MMASGGNNMSFFKAIEHGKEKRRPWRKAKAIDRTCCNHGSCPWCRDNRRHRFIVAEKLKGDSNEDDGAIEQ